MPPVKFHPNGIVEVDSAQEAAIFDALRAIERTKAASKFKRPSTTQTGWAGFFDLLQQSPRREGLKILALVKGRGVDGITVDELATQIEANPKVIVGGFAAIARRAGQVGLEFQDILVRGPDLKYRPGPILESNQPPTP